MSTQHNTAVTDPPAKRAIPLLYFMRETWSSSGSLKVADDNGISQQPGQIISQQKLPKKSGLNRRM